MIMGLESSNTKITVDAIKSKLMDAGHEKETQSSAFFGKNKQSKKGKNRGNVTCFKCKKGA